MVNVGVVLGTGFNVKIGREFVQETDYGPVNMFEITMGGKKVLGVKRHEALEVPDIMPELAYIQALKLNEVDIILATSATGRLYDEIWPGNLMVPSDVVRHGIDERLDTYTQKGLLMHLPPNPLFSDNARQFLIDAWPNVKEEVEKIYTESDLPIQSQFYDEGIVHIVSGPSFRTRAEEEMIRTTISLNDYLSGYQHLIGMTPREALAAAEMGIDYAVLANCSDHSTYPGHPPVTHEQVGQTLNTTGATAFMVLEEAIRLIPEDYKPQSRIPIVSEKDFNHDQVVENGSPYLAQIIEQEFEMRKS